MQDAVQAAAARVLSDQPDAPVRVRLLRDVLCTPPADPELVAATRSLDGSPHVQLLAQEQRDDGGWGRFHSQDYSAKQRIVTTEAGVGRAVELGLSPDHRILSRARLYLEGILDGSIPFPDRAEKHDSWQTGVEMFAGAMLSRFAPESPGLDSTWTFWASVLQRSFSRGTHDLDEELKAHWQLSGRSGKPGWLRLNSKYVLMILGARGDRLPADVKCAYVRWLWEGCPKGLVYFDVPFVRSPRQLKGARLHGWLSSLELLAVFPSARDVALPAAEMLLACRNADGLWDFGTQPSCPHFSDTWRKKNARIHDWTMRVSCLLNKFLR